MWPSSRFRLRIGRVFEIEKQILNEQNMKRIRNTMIFSAVMSMAFLSCSKELDQPEIGSGLEAQFKAGMATRAHDGQWDYNDAIGIAMLSKDDGLIIGDFYNYQYVIDDPDLFEFVPGNSNKRIFFPQDGSMVNFRAYYPYLAELERDMTIPLSVANQDNLLAIDFMTADHKAEGYSKSDKLVDLNFHHRLSNLVFNIQTEDGQPALTLEDIQLTIKGMYAGGVYNLMEEKLTVDPSTGSDITVPYKGKFNDQNNRQAIVMPRPAGEGIVFEFATPDGGVFTVKMDSQLELLAEHRYIFNIKLLQSEIEVSATVVPWKTMDPIGLNAVRITADPGATDASIQPGTVMDVFLRNAGHTYDHLRYFTYTGSDVWQPDVALYWDDVKHSPAWMIGAITPVSKYDPSQMPDILLSQPTRVERYEAADFELSHATSRITVELYSTEFTVAQLDNATVRLPDYLTGGRIVNGAFVPGTDRVDVRMVRPGGGGNPLFGLIQPQTLSAGTPLAIVTIDGVDYEAVRAMETVFEPGYTHKMRLNVDKADVLVSVTVTPWEEKDPIDLETLMVGVSFETGDNDPTLQNGDEMTLYTEDENNPTLRKKLALFTYNGTDWIPDTPVYWEALPNPATFYASMLVKANSTPDHEDDYLIADPIKVRRGQPVPLTLRHPVAQAVIQLRSSDGSFTDDELKEMAITLPNYRTGGMYDNGVYKPGDVEKSIAVPLDPTGTRAVALIQPQSKAAGNTVVTLSRNGFDYEAKYAGEVKFEAGKVTVLKLDVTKSKVGLSVQLVPWGQGPDYALIAGGVAVSGSLGDTDTFFVGKSIYVYPLDQTTSYYKFTYQGGTWNGDRTIYWDDLMNTHNLLGVYFPDTYIWNGSGTSIPWPLAFDQSAAESKPDGSDNKFDILTAVESVDPQTPKYINFAFNHPLSRFRIEIHSDEFTEQELNKNNVSVVFKNFIRDGVINLQGKAVDNGSKGDITPCYGEYAYAPTNGKFGSYSAIVYPQTIAKGETVAVITLADYLGEPFVVPVVWDGDGGNQNLEFKPGLETFLKITLRKKKIEISASYKKWGAGQQGGIIID